MSGEFYKNARKYWAKIPATIDGVLGGFAHISDIDLAGSRAFISETETLFNENLITPKLALDCGAGIGRIAKNLLIPLGAKVDIVEQDEKFAIAAVDDIGADNVKLGDIYNMGLQDFYPKKLYDIIWCQWVLGHLNDDDLCAFLERCRESLTDTGVIYVKENVTADDEIEFDEVDSSVTRPYELLLKIFDVAGLKVVHTRSQENFPDDIYSVFMFGLVPHGKSTWESSLPRDD